MSPHLGLPAGFETPQPLRVWEGRRPDQLLSLLQDEFPVRDDPSDVTDEDEALAQPPPPPKLPLPTFRLKNDSDLFGLGLEEAGPKESSEEGGRGQRSAVSLLESG